jgi:hypothetical protein
MHTVLKIVSDAFELLKHLRGESPKAVTHSDGMIHVENNQGVINSFGPNSIVVLNDPAVSKAARSFVGRPLERSADRIEVLADDQVIASATASDSNFFVPLDIKDVLAEHVSKMHVTIQTAVLEGSNRWKFNDGKSTFTAPIEDPAFLSAVAEGREAFRKGDELVVEMQSIQKRVNGKLKAEHLVKRVLRHVSPPPQRAFL